jgi:hypothetical protein
MEEYRGQMEEALARLRELGIPLLFSYGRFA